MNSSSDEKIVVLLIDDQAIISESIRRMLASESDITFHYCNNPLAALKMAQECKPTVILQDLIMPQMDGLLLVKFLRAKDLPTAIVPLIVLSSKEEPIVKAKAFALGANDYLVKLPDALELIARIRYHSKAYINFLKRQEAEALLKAENIRQAAYIEQVAKVTTAASDVEQDTFQPDMLQEVAQRSDELGQLARVFTQMVNTVKIRERQLTEANQQLESLLVAYERFVPNEYLRFLRKNSITEVKLGDHVSKIMAIMFSDIRSFTTLAETMTPQEIFNFVNAYLKRVTPEIRNHYGLVVKFLGDGVMAVFPEGADDAVASGISQLKRIEAYNQERVLKGFVPLKIGIGIHVGHTMLGMIGEETRMQGDTLSDNVNLTARLEGLTKFYGVSLLISQQTYENLSHPDNYQIRFLDRAIVKGRNEPISVYEIIDAEVESIQQLKIKTLHIFEQGWEYYRQGNLPDAQACFEAVLSVNPEDKTAQLYLERVSFLTHQGVPENWSGVWAFTEK